MRPQANRNGPTTEIRWPGRCRDQPGPLRTCHDDVQSLSPSPRSPTYAVVATVSPDPRHCRNHQRPVSVRGPGQCTRNRGGQLDCFASTIRLPPAMAITDGMRVHKCSDLVVDQSLGDTDAAAIPGCIHTRAPSPGRTPRSRQHQTRFARGRRWLRGQCTMPVSPPISTRETSSVRFCPLRGRGGNHAGPLRICARDRIARVGRQEGCHSNPESLKMNALPLRN
jgi:hypothetical protein